MMMPIADTSDSVSPVRTSAPSAPIKAIGQGHRLSLMVRTDRDSPYVGGIAALDMLESHADRNFLPALPENRVRIAGERVPHGRADGGDRNAELCGAAVDLGADFGLPGAYREVRVEDAGHRLHPLAQGGGELRQAL